MLRLGGLFAEIGRSLKNEGTKSTGVLWGFYAACVGVYMDALKI